jgi:hypothetical protein
MAAQEETIWLRGENGIVFEQRLPLTEGFADRITKGYMSRVANAAGDPYVEHAAPPAPAPAGPGAPADPTAPPATPVSTGPVPFTGPTAPNPPDLKKDRKADFVGYVVRYVVKPDGSRWTPDEGDAATKHDLHDAIAAWATRTGVSYLDAAGGA